MTGQIYAASLLWRFIGRGGPKIGVPLSWKMQACLRQAPKYGPRPRQNVIIDTGPIALSQKSIKVAIWSKR